MLNIEDKTINYYDNHALDWTQAHHGFEEKSFWSDWMDKFHKLLPTGKIIEIGSGSGKDAYNLIRLGYDYIGSDASKGLIEIAKKRNPNFDFKNIKAQDLADNFDEDTFNGFWTAATLLHIPKNQVQDTLANISKVIKNNGIGFISVKSGTGEKEDETGRLFSFYSSSEFKNILEKCGFEILESGEETRPANTTWLIYLVKVIKN